MAAGVNPRDVSPTYAERLVAPPAWWAAVLALGIVFGWVMLVATNPAIAATVAATTVAIVGGTLWRAGALAVSAGPDFFRVGEAHLERPDLGAITALDGADWQQALRDHAGSKSFVLTRPWVSSGVLLEVKDPGDPTPAWLVSTRRPATVVRTVGQTMTTTEDERT